LLIEKDYEEFLRLLNKFRVRYCIIGAFAVAFFGKPRYTKDIDILVDANEENGKRIVKALERFGFRSLGLRKEDFSKRNIVIQLGYEPVRIDIITSLPGCSFGQVWRHKTEGYYGKERVFFIGINELITNKKRSKRKQDKVDLKLLLRAKSRNVRNKRK